MLTEHDRKAGPAAILPRPRLPEGEFVHDWIRARAVEVPDAPALVAGSGMLSYSELDGGANRIAGELAALGVKADDVIGLCAGRSMEWILGALAIWKAGAAYVPLDAAYPAERLRFIAADAGCTVVLTARDVGHVFAGCVKTSIAIDRKGPRVARPPPASVSLEHLAYVTYTSGSTGKPKGVEIARASLVNLVRWHQRAFAVGREDRASQVAAVGFDAAVWEVWPYLAAGATICIPDEAARTEPEAFRDWLLAERITIAFAPTPLAERLVALRWPPATRLRTLLTGGDILHRAPSPDLPFLLVNNYGPTESTVVATSGPVDPYDPPDRRPTIGRAIDNTQIYVLDERRVPVPPGEAGELWIGGAGVARGYRNRPDLTEARFVPSPFEPGQRLYRTGDRGRILPDGQIAFMGRTDDQIKIRGFRIEPNEIVGALNRCPGIAASAVVAMDLGAGDRRLVAYVVPEQGFRPTRRALEEVLRVSLPEYMIPTVFVRLERLPLGPHGKVDRTALAEPNAANSLRDTEFEGARTPVEERIAALVESLVKIDAVSVDDNFFLLGGHSLLGTQLIARISALFEVEMGLRDVFEAPTVARLAAKVEQRLVAKLEAMTEDEARRLVTEDEARRLVTEDEARRLVTGRPEMAAS